MPSPLQGWSRVVGITALLAVPVAIIWNLTTEHINPSLRIAIGKHLAGVTHAPPPAQLSWSSLANGDLQKAVGAAIAEAYPLRPLLIRINNEIRFTLFGYISAPGLFQGANGQLIETAYLTEYCSRGNDPSPEERARIAIPKLKAIQAHYRARNHIFIHLISPSKVAYMPENFVHRTRCPSTEDARKRLVPTYVRLLREAGITVIDTASLIHSLRGSYKVEIFPQGGVHWNMLGVARAAELIIDEINRQSQRPRVPKPGYSYVVVNRLTGTDSELTDVMNVMFPHLVYPTASVTFTPSARCEAHDASQLDIAMVGGSFTHNLAMGLIGPACLWRLNLYYYLTLGRFGGVKYERLQANLTPKDLTPLLDAEVMILEENESLLGQPHHLDRLYSFVTGAFPR
jgi:alginate O-acetyltransferase complex protein AlgJ